MTIVPPETAQLARLVAARSGRTLEEVLKAGVETEARIAGIPLDKDANSLRNLDFVDARAIARGIAARPLLDPREPQTILDEAWAHSDDRRR